MDDHHPAGFRSAKIGSPATIFHEAPSPYGIPYRSLYSRGIDNLMFAGRCASCTHAAMSSTRVMGTGCSMGQAVGTAAAMAVARGETPRGLGKHIDELQQTLLGDDCYLPWVSLKVSALTTEAKLAASQGNCEPVRDGIGRQVGQEPHCWVARPGDWVAYQFHGPKHVQKITLLLDSAMDQKIAMSYHQRDNQLTSVPSVTPKAFSVETLSGGKWMGLVSEETNHHRFRQFEVGKEIEGIRFILKETWGSEQSRVYGFYID